MSEVLVPPDEPERLAALRAYEVLDTPPEEAFDRITALAARIFRVPIALVSLIDHERQWWKSCYGMDGRETVRKLAFCAHAILAREVMVVPDAARDERFRENPLVTREPGIRFYAGSPLISRSGHALGTLCILDRVPRGLTAEERATLSDLAAMAVDELELRSAGRDLATEIAARKRIEQELESRVELRTRELSAAEAKYRAIFEHAVDGIFQTSLDGHYLDANPSLARMYGYGSVEELMTGVRDIGRELYVDPTRRGDFVRGMRNEGEVTAFEAEVRRRDGSTMWVSETARIVANAGGEPMYYEGIVEDITARKRAERELHGAQAQLESRVVERTEALELASAENLRLAAAISSATTGVLISDARRPDNPAIFVNPAFEEITGYRAEETLGRNCRFLQGPETDDSVIGALRVAVAQRRSFQGLLLNYRKDGTPFWNELTVNPVFDAEGALVNFVGLQNDVTARVTAEAGLRASEERYKRIAANVPGMVYQFVLRPDGSMAFPFVSDGSRAACGLEPRVIEADAGALLERIFPDDAGAFQAGVAESARTLEPWHWEGRFRGPADDLRWMQAASRPERQENGDILWDGLVVDVTELKRVEQALREAKEMAERANQAKSEFLSRMSHELRTPLNAILGFSQLLQRRALDAKQAENVEFIRKAGLHLLDLINEVLDLSRIEAGRTNIQIQVVDVAEVLGEALSLVRQEADKRGLVLDTDGASACGLCVHADRKRLKQILLNLLSNAVKYNREGGRIEVRCEAAANCRVALRVIDSGPGLAEAQLERVFIPFDRLGAEGRGIEGTGIGLSLSLRLARLMGGDLEVASELGRGSTFTLRLPEAGKGGR